MTGLAYIGGYGRSGSTLLETLLTMRPDVLACGEVASCLHVDVRRPCTCGKICAECAVWGAFYNGPERLQGWTHKALVLALLDNAPAHYRLLVDSSKTAWSLFGAPLKLRRKLGGRFHLVHIVRDPRGVSWSTLGGPWKRRLEESNRILHYPKTVLRIFWTSLGWWVANLSCELFAWRFPKQYLRVRYEDLIQSPSTVLDQVLSHSALGQRSPLVEIDSSGNRHQLHGNEGRRRISSIEDVRADVRWKNEMPADQRCIAAALTWPLRLRYGY